MRKSLFWVMLLCIACMHPAASQIRTVETRTAVDSASGDTTITKAVIVSTTEDITPRNSMLVVNPLKFFLFYNLTYFHRLSPSSAVGFGIQVPTLGGIDGVGFNAEIRLYPSAKSLRGFYFAPNFAYNHFTNGNASTSPTSLGVLIGWQWFPGDEFAMGLGLGVDYYFGSISDSHSDWGRYDGTVPALRFDIGYAW
jgi:hypothetical protein